MSSLRSSARAARLSMLTRSQQLGLLILLLAFVVYVLIRLH